MTTVYGVDIASFQQGIDLSEVKREGFDFVWIKATQGSNYINPDWAVWQEQAVANGLIVAGYHYLDTTPVAAQAQLFVNTLGDVPAMVDFEQGGGDIDNFWAFVHAVNALGKQISLSYIPHWYWQQIGSPDLSGVPGLIASSYVGGSGAASALYPGDDFVGWNSYGNATPALLQFTDSALVAGMSVDANAFRGTCEQLTALLGGVGTNPVELTSSSTPLPGTGATMAAPDPFLDAELTDAYGNPIKVRDILMWTGYHADLLVDQVGGAGTRASGNPAVIKGWPQLNNRSIVDALAEIGAHLGIAGYQPPTDLATPVVTPPAT
jgi:lysozyme